MKSKQITEEEIIGTIDSSLDSMEKLRREDLERIKLLRTIKNRALEKEHERLSEKLGVEHPKVKKMAARIQSNRRIESFNIRTKKGVKRDKKNVESHNR